MEVYVNLEVLEQEVPLHDFGMEGMKQCQLKLEFWRARSCEHGHCLGLLERTLWLLEQAGFLPRPTFDQKMRPKP